MITKRIAISFLTVVGVLALVAALAVAQFTDEAQLTGNTFSTGSGDLLISDTPGGLSCSESSFLSAIVGISEPTADLAPGQSVSKDFCLLNDSDSDIDLAVTAAVTGVSGTLFDEGDEGLVDLTISCEGEGDEDVVGTLAGFPSPLEANDVVTTLGQGEQVDCTITAGLSELADNDQADKTISFDVIFTGTQTP